MAPKHGLTTPNSGTEKRAKTESTTSKSMSPPAASVEKVPFMIAYPPEQDKKRLTKHEQLVKDKSEFLPFPLHIPGTSRNELDASYAVLPNEDGEESREDDGGPGEDWDSMKKYNNFIIQGDTFKNNDFVFVKGRSETGTRPQDFWVARIVQVRAKDSQHVYALVAWMYWPFELPNHLRHKYHGKDEVVPSNYMEVLDVLSFAGKAEVHYFNEKIVNGVVPDVPKTLYWRQMFSRITQKLTDMPGHCVCGGHYNPDIPMYICDNNLCSTMFHPECLIEAHLNQKYRKEYPENGTEPVTNGTSKKKGAKSKAPPKRKIYAGKFRGELLDSTPLSIKVTSYQKHGEPSTERIPCPKCSTLFE